MKSTVKGLITASIVVGTLLLFSLVPAVPISNVIFAHNKDSLSFSDLGVTELDSKLGSKIKGLETPSGTVSFGSVITCGVRVTCIGTNNDDIIYPGAKAQVFALNGDDVVYVGLDDQAYGGRNDDLLIAPTGGRNLLDGGPNEDVLIAGLGNDLLIGGKGNDKLFAGGGSTVMYGGPGANHFECVLSAIGLAKSVVMDYNPANGDTISGPCKIVNTIGNGNTDIPQITLPDTDGNIDSLTSGS